MQNKTPTKQSKLRKLLDCAESCKLVNQEDLQIESSLESIIQEVKQSCSKEDSWRLKWIPRKQNRLAHGIAKWSARSNILGLAYKKKKEVTQAPNRLL